MTFGVEPAVELQVAKPDAHAPEFIAHGEQRADVSQPLLEPVVVLRAVVGPIAEYFKPTSASFLGRDLPARS